MLNAALINDYLTLCKPRVVLLMLITAWIGMYLASPNFLQWRIIIFSTIGIGCAASAAAVINHLMDRHIDGNMARTATRPLASGRIYPYQAIIFAICLICIAWAILSIFVNMLTTILTFATIIGYAIIYTMYLKRATPQNIVIGGISGAMPPLLGWTAISGEINSDALLLTLIIFTWTPPHFWALAIYRVNDYKTAKIPMLPVTHGIFITKVCLLAYTFLLLAVSCLPFVTKLAGIIYLISALNLNLVFIYYATRLLMAKEMHEHYLAIKTFNFSIIYLLLLFMTLLIDSGIHL